MGKAARLYGKYRSLSGQGRPTSWVFATATAGNAAVRLKPAAKKTPSKLARTLHGNQIIG